MLIISSLVSLLNCIILLMLPSDRVHEVAKSSTIKVFKEAFKNIKASKTMLLLASVTIILGGLWGMLEEYVPLVFVWNSLPEGWVPSILALSVLANAILTPFGHRFSNASLHRCFGTYLQQYEIKLRFMKI